MKRVGQFHQTFSNEKEEKPGDQNSQGALRKPENCREGESLSKRLARQFFKAGGADNAIIVFCNTLTAEKLVAFRTACDGFARGVIETALLRESLHQGFRKG
jgi:hypothetical protein